jgi:putative pyruvate formate lyase activating enzyme
LSGVTDYSSIVRRNHKLAYDDAELVMRHLILPNHGECCTRPILEFIAKQFGDRVIVNLMDQYRPCFRADEHADINRRITSEEFRQAESLARNLGLNYIA